MANEPAKAWYRQSGSTVVDAELTATNAGTSPVTFTGDFNLSLSGTWAGTLALERSFDAGVTWREVETFTANEEKVITNVQQSVRWRVRFKARTSGTAVIHLSR